MDKKDYDPVVIGGGLQERLLAWLAGFFGLVALIASCLDLYGMTAFQVTRRTNEIGIRIALGARGMDLISVSARRIAPVLAAHGVDCCASS